MSEKGRGAKIVLQFTDDLTSIPSGAASAFTVSGQERLHAGGPLVDGDYQVESLSRYPAERVWELSESAMLDSEYGDGYSDVTAIGTQVASNYFGAGYEIANAFDKNETTRWYATGTVDRWIGLDFTSKKNIRKFRAYINDGRFKGFVFEASNDNATWTPLLTGDFPSTTQWNECTFTNENTYRYYRLRCTSVYTGSNVSVAELEMYERDRVYVTPKTIVSGMLSAD